MADDVRLLVHGHFYQPPRENPWSEEVPVEPSAAPFHDWNERITAEAYRPNGWARVVDERGRVDDIIDNYAYLSFNVGPTLMSWLDAHHPDVLARMVEADGMSGGAIAQAYNHMILPLANERDIRTQVRWGLADFAFRFGRPASAVWLPETAVNDAVLRVLAEERVRSTLLAPNQAARVRPLGAGDDEWADVTDGSVTAGVPHRWIHPEFPDLHVDLVFYDGGLSHDLAFALSGLSSQDLVARVQATAADGTPVVVATDGETFGHHHKFADRALAYTFAHEAPACGVRTVHLRQLIDELPPTHQVEIRESAWSCAHGVGRWKENCGCSTGGEPGWNQEWRAPLRHALDLLRDHAAGVFERRGGPVFSDPWAARDAYIDVLLGAVEIDAFLDKHAHAGIDPVEALTLLEIQRQSMLMYTSCGWFFNDLAGIETVQVLRYAARAIDLLAELDEPAPVAEFLAVLDQARSNRAEEGTGADLWHRDVIPSRVDAERVVAHLALLDLLEQRGGGAVVGGFEVVEHERRHRHRGGLTGVAGRVEVVQRRTRRAATLVYAAVRIGGLEVLGGVRPADPDRDDDCFTRLSDAVDGGERITTILRLIGDDFGPHEFGLESALPDAAGDIVASTAHALTDRFGAALEAMWDDNRAVLDAIATAGHPLEAELKAPVEMAVGRRVRSALAVVAGPDGADAEVAAAAVRDASEAAWAARNLGVDAASDRTNAALADAVLAQVGRALTPGEDGEEVDGAAAQVVLDLLRLRRPLGIVVDLDRPQELVVDALAARPDDETVARLADALGVAGRR